MTGLSSLPLAITMGDPAGCGPQITAQLWEARQTDERPFFVIGDPDAYAPHVPIRLIEEAHEAADVIDGALPLIALPSTAAILTGTPNPAHAEAILGSIRLAVSCVQSGDAAALVTNPINKAVLYEAGFKHPGHTEFLAALCTKNDLTPQPVMMLVGGGLRVALATIHMPHRDVPGALTQDHLIRLAQIVAHDLETRFGIETPRLAFSGLNPHAGENGTMGREEIEVINPAAAALRSKGVTICDARPGDTVFAEALDGAYDAVIAMTHDQGLIPVKTLDFWGGVNVTLGLPIIRTSPDHGTAYEAAAAGQARAGSLIQAVKLAGEMATRSLS